VRFRIIDVTRILKFAFPAAVGVPLRTPEAESDSPAGRFPETRLHEYVDGTPPVAANVTE
jgi:hypothetical protein